MVWATSDTERPVPRYLFTCLQFTVPANPGPAVPSNSATPITSVPSFMREPPCACAQPLDADRAARGTPSACIATPLREGKLRRPAPSRPGSRAALSLRAPPEGRDDHARARGARADGRGDRTPRTDTDRRGTRAPGARPDGHPDRTLRPDPDRRTARAPRARTDGRG